MTKKQIGIVALIYFGVCLICVWCGQPIPPLIISFMLAAVFLGISIKRHCRLKRAEKYKRDQIKSRLMRHEEKRTSAALELIRSVNCYVSGPFDKKHRTDPFAPIVLRAELNAIYDRWKLQNDHLFPDNGGRIHVIGVRAGELIYKFPKEIEAYRCKFPAFKTRA